MINLVCINCPNSCSLEIDLDTLKVTGNKCKRGIEFATNEVTNPKRTIQTTVKTIFKDCRVLPVRTNVEIPKDKIFDVMKVINSYTLDHKVKRGEIIIANILNLNVDIIATSNILIERNK